MLKYLLLFSILLTGCQAIPTTKPEPVDVRITVDVVDSRLDTPITKPVVETISVDKPTKVTCRNAHASDIYKVKLVNKEPYRKQGDIEGYYRAKAKAYEHMAKAIKAFNKRIITCK